MVELLGKSKEELRAFCAGLGEPAYRGEQIYHALFAERKFYFALMTNVPGAADDLHLNASGMRRGLPLLPDGAARTHSKFDGGRNRGASPSGAGRAQGQIDHRNEGKSCQLRTEGCRAEARRYTNP